MCVCELVVVRAAVGNIYDRTEGRRRGRRWINVGGGADESSFTVSRRDL